MIAHVALRAKLSKVDEVIVCTDSYEIARICESYDIGVVVTRSNHLNGSERIAEAAQHLNIRDSDIVIDVQGDEPLVEPSYINQVHEYMETNGSNCVVPYQEISGRQNVNIVKIIESQGTVLAFSRSDVPNFFKHSGQLKKHLSVIGLRKHALRIFQVNQPGPLEKIESVELYRLLEVGLTINTFRMEGESQAVDTNKDYERVCRIMETDPLYRTIFK